MIDVTIRTEYITLGQLLKLEKIIVNGSDAKIYLLENSVYVNNQLEKRRGRKLYDGDEILVNNKKFIIKR